MNLILINNSDHKRLKIVTFFHNSRNISAPNISNYNLILIHYSSLYSLSIILRINSSNPRKVQKKFYLEFGYFICNNPCCS